MSKHFGYLLAALLAGVAWPAGADTLTFDPTVAFIDHDGPNTVGLTPGQNITLVSGFVAPNVGTVMTATQGGTTIPLQSLFTASGRSNSLHFAGETPLSSGLTGSWQIVGTNITGTESTAVRTTNNLIGVSVLDRPTNLQVNNPVDTGSLSPTVSWTNPVGGHNVNYLEVWSDRTDTLITTVNCSGSATCSSINVPAGLLAPTGEYSFRVLAESRGVTNNFFTTTTRSNSFINHTATSTDRQVGNVLALDSSNVDTGAVITSGANNLPDVNLLVGHGGGNGAVTIDSASSLTGTFINLGRSSNDRGTLLVDGGQVHLDGSGSFPNPNGGFLTVGRGGAGFAEIINGATVVMEANGQPFAGFQVGRDTGSFGHMVVSGTGTTVTVDGSSVSGSADTKGFIRVGRNGTGRLDILDGAVVSNDPAARTSVGFSDVGTGRGALIVDGANSRLNAGSILDIGGNGGEGLVQVRNGGSVFADTVNVNDGGVLAGIGSVTGNVNLFAGGFIQPGLSPGILVIDGDLVMEDGTLLLEANSLADIDQIVVTGNAIFRGGMIEVLLGFAPAPSDILSFFDVQGTTTVESTFGGVDVFAPIGSGVPQGAQVAVQIGNDVFTSDVEFAAVPEPASLGLLTAAVLLFGRMRRRERFRKAAA